MIKIYRVPDSGMEPYFSEGESLPVDPSAELRQGDVCLFLAGDKLTCRQIIEDSFGNVYLLHPGENKKDDYITIWARLKNDVDVTFLGKVVTDKEIPLPGDSTLCVKSKTAARKRRRHSEADDY